MPAGSSLLRSLPFKIIDNKPCAACSRACHRDKQRHGDGGDERVEHLLRRLFHSMPEPEISAGETATSPSSPARIIIMLAAAMPAFVRTRFAHASALTVAPLYGRPALTSKWW